MHARLVGSTLVVLTHVAAAGDAPGPVPGAPVAPAPSAKAARPKTPEEAADAVLAAIERGDKEAVRVLAGKDALDPWMLADELIGRGRRPAADAFTKDVVGIDLQALPRYVASHERWRHPYFWAAWTLWGLPE